MAAELAQMGPGFLITLSILIVWTLVWKAIGLWRAGRNRQKAWFIWMFILNTAGILPILYLAYYQKIPKELREQKK